MRKKEEDINLSDFRMGFRASETADVEMSIGDTIVALRENCEFFIHFFLGEELDHPVPEFHKEAWQYLTAVALENVALALPRGHAKTTLARLAVVWYLLFTPFRFILYVSNTLPVASESTKAIAEFFRSENFESVFGRVRFEVEQDQRGFYKFFLSYIDETGTVQSKYCILKPLGAGQQIRGTNIDNIRPELSVVDDLEDDDNTATALLQNKLKKWFMGAFQKALSRRNRKIIFLGNMLSSKSILYHICEKSEEWYSTRKGCILSDGTPLWPEIWPIDKIRTDFLEYQNMKMIGVWFAEMMNLPIADGNLLIQPEEIQYVPELVPGEQEYTFITLDTAISQKAWGNDTAFAVHASKAGIWRIVEVVSGQFTPDRTFFILCELGQKWSTRVLGIEQTALQQALKFLFEVFMTIHKQYFEIYDIPHKNIAKTERLSVWCSFLRRGVWVLQEGDFVITQQLLTYDPTKDNNEDDIHKDDIDNDNNEEDNDSDDNDNDIRHKYDKYVYARDFRAI